MDFYCIDTKGAKIGPIEFDDIENLSLKPIHWCGCRVWQRGNPRQKFL